MQKIFSLISGVLLTGVIVNTGHPSPYWAKLYGGNGEESVNRVRQTRDDGYILAGGTTSFAAASKDGWVLKLNQSGDVIWGKTYGGSGDEFFADIEQTADDGYIVAGGTTSFGTASADTWILKLNPNGGIIWQKTYGGGDNNSTYSAYSIQQTLDGGYIIAGTIDTDPSSNREYDFWILKLDHNGNIIWQMVYGGIDDDYACSILQTSDGGYIVEGITSSFGAGNKDIWILKLNPNGDIIWQKTYGGSYNDSAYSIQQTSDGGYVVAGYTYSFGVSNADCWVFKLDSEGDIVWQKTYGSTLYEYTDFIQQTSEGGYILAGLIINFTPVQYGDILLLKLDSNGNIEWHETYDLDIRTINFSIEQTTDSGYVVAGVLDYSFGNPNAQSTSVWGLKVSERGEIPGCSLMNNQGCSADTSTASAHNTTASIKNIPITVAITDISSQNSLVEDLVLCCYDEEDNDQDGIGNDCDNCPNTLNPLQEDTFPPGGNEIGDACDCEADLNCDGIVDAGDITPFLDDFGRSQFFNPCTNESQCKGDFDCNGRVDGADITKILEDFGRSQFNNPCPACEGGDWCSY